MHTHIRARIKAIRRRKRHFAPLVIHTSPSPPPSFRIFMTHRAVLFVSSLFLLYGYNISSWKIANVINLIRDWMIRNDIRYLILSILNFSKFAKKDLRCIVILYLYIYCCRDIKFYPRKLKISIAGGIGSVNEGTFVKGMYSMVSISMIKFWEYLAGKKVFAKLFINSRIQRGHRKQSRSAREFTLNFFLFPFFFFFLPSTIFYILIAYLHAKLILSRYNITNA